VRFRKFPRDLFLVAFVAWLPFLPVAAGPYAELVVLPAFVVAAAYGCRSESSRIVELARLFALSCLASWVMFWFFAIAEVQWE